MILSMCSVFCCSVATARTASSSQDSTQDSKQGRANDAANMQSCLMLFASCNTAANSHDTTQDSKHVTGLTDLYTVGTSDYASRSKQVFGMWSVLWQMQNVNAVQKMDRSYLAQVLQERRLCESACKIRQGHRAQLCYCLASSSAVRVPTQHALTDTFPAPL